MTIIDRFQLFKQRHSRLIITLSLSLIIFGYVGNNLIWAGKSPIFFYRDSMLNIHWAVYFGKWLRNEQLAYRPDIMQIMQNRNIGVDPSIYNQESYEALKGPITNKKKIMAGDILRFHHPPIWFMFLGGLFAVFGFQPWVIYLAQSLLGAITIWLVYLIGKKIYSPSAGLLSAFILSTLPSFLIITRQGFLEAMICPVVLIGVMLIYHILENPFERIYYYFLGFICGAGLLIKSAFFPYSVIFFIVIYVFTDKRKVSRGFLLKNIFISIVLMILMALPWHIYAYQSVLPYSMKIIKLSSLIEFDPEYFFIAFSIIKNSQLGIILFVFFILGAIHFCFKPKPDLFCLAFFIILGYLLTIFSPSVRHFSPLLPLSALVIPYGIIGSKRFKQLASGCLIFFGLVRGYGLFSPKIFPADQMAYLYNDIGIKEKQSMRQKYIKNIHINFDVYVTGIKEKHFLSFFAPLSTMRQKYIYKQIKKIHTFSGLKLIALIYNNKSVLEARTLAGALCLYSMSESYPLIVECLREGPCLMRPEYFEDRIWIFLRANDEKIVDRKELGLRYVTSLPLSHAVFCDIFRETKI